MPTYIAPILQQQGYIGATGTTPYQGSSAAQVSTLQNQASNALVGQTITQASAGRTQLSVNFDGTQNNSAYVPSAEFQTNVANLFERQQRGGNPLNIPRVRSCNNTNKPFA